MDGISVKKGKASKYVGVFRAGTKWKAQLQHKNRSIYLGCFQTEEEAAQVYQLEKAKILGTPAMPADTGFLRSRAQTASSLMYGIIPASTEMPSLQRQGPLDGTPLKVNVGKDSYRHAESTTSSTSQASTDGNGAVGESQRVLLIVEVDRVQELMERINLGERLSASTTPNIPHSTESLGRAPGREIC